jgi:hypothetical protein
MRAHDASIADALRSALHDIRDLIRAELELARAELGTEFARIRAGVLALAMGALFAAAGFMFFLAAIAWAIVGWFNWPIWTGFALVAAGTLPFTVALTILGVSRLNRERHMARTVDTMKENVKWLQARTS